MDKQNKLINSFNASEWAKEFMLLYKKKNNDWVDESLMLSWFANAIMTGYDHAWNTRPKELCELDEDEVFKFLEDECKPKYNHYRSYAKALCKRFGTPKQLIRDELVGIMVRNIYAYIDDDEEACIDGLYNSADAILKAQRDKE